MTPDMAIAAITQALRQQLQTALDRVDGLGAEAKTERPVTLTDRALPIANVYLYQATINPHRRNDDLVPRILRSGNGGGEFNVVASSVRSWRVPLRLNYLLSFYGDEGSLIPQRLLAICVATLHRWPILDATAIAAAAAHLANSGEVVASSEIEPVTITFDNLTLHDGDRLWSALGADYALSACYFAETAIVWSTPRTQSVDLVLDVDVSARTLPERAAMENGRPPDKG